MVALTADRKTPHLERRRVRSFGIGADEVIYQGALVAMDSADGFLYAGAVSTTLIAVGYALETVDATGELDGALTVEVAADVARWDNSSAGDLIEKDDIGATCYIVDDQTVALTDGTGTRSPAGVIWDVDDDGVWVVPPNA